MCVSFGMFGVFLPGIQGGCRVSLTSLTLLLGSDVCVCVCEGIEEGDVVFLMRFT